MLQASKLLCSRTFRRFLATNHIRNGLMENNFQYSKINKHAIPMAVLQYTPTDETMLYPILPTYKPYG